MARNETKPADGSEPKAKRKVNRTPQDTYAALLVCDAEGNPIQGATVKVLAVSNGSKNVKSVIDAFTGNPGSSFQTFSLKAPAAEPNQA